MVTPGNLESDFAAARADIASVETLVSEVKAQIAKMSGDSGSFTAFQADFAALVALADKLDAALGSPSV